MNATLNRSLRLAPLAALILTACGGSGSSGMSAMGSSGMSATGEPIRLSGPLSLAAVSSDAVTDGSTGVADTLANFPASISADFATRFPSFSEDERSRTINFAGGSIVSESWGIEAESADESIEVEASYSAEGSFLSSQTSTEIAALPMAIATAVAQLYPGASVDDAYEITDDNNIVSYEVELEDASTELELLLDGSGNLLSSEEEISMADVPAAILTSVNQEIVADQEVEFERVTRGDGSIVYEAELEGDRESVSITYSESGEVLSMEYEAE